jgi:hypothetical protein
MKYLNSYKVFEDSSDIYVKSYTKEEFVKSLYDYDNMDLKDPTIEKRIRYFNFNNDMGYSFNENTFHFIVLYDKDKVIGICKIGHYSGNERGDDPNYMSISYCSIDRNYRGKGYLNIMIEELMKLCKEKGFDLGSSSWTVAGNVKLRPTIKKWAKKYGVDFLDHDRRFDTESLYNTELVSVEEMTPEEKAEFDHLKYGIKPNTGFRKLFYDTGKYKIFSTQTDYDDEHIEKIYDDIRGNKYRYHSPEGKIAGYFYKDKYYITEGHHRILAALRYWKRWGSYLPVEKMIKLGNFEERKEPVYHKFPRKMMEDFHYENYPKPDWFYLVLKTSRYDDRPWKQLLEMNFKGLQGISDSPDIINSWLDVRDVLLIMDAKKVMELNNIHPVYYHNSDQLVSNNLKILMRLVDNTRGDVEYNIRSTIIKICQYADNIHRHLGNRKRAKIYGTWKQGSNKKIYSDLIGYIGDTHFYYMFSDYTTEEIKNGYKVKNVGDLLKLVGKMIREKEDKLTEFRGKWFKDFKPFVEHYKKYGTKFIEKVFRWCITSLSRSFVNESEWIVKSPSFTIPEKSHLIIKTYPGRDSEKYDEWFEQTQIDKERYKENKISYDSRGVEEKKIKHIIDKYHLDEIYNVELVNNRFRAWDIVKNKYMN